MNDLPSHSSLFKMAVTHMLCCSLELVLSHNYSVGLPSSILKIEKKQRGKMKKWAITPSSLLHIRTYIYTYIHTYIYIYIYPVTMATVG